MDSNMRTSSDSMPEDFGSIFFRIAMRWAQEVWLRDLGASVSDRSRAQRRTKLDLATYLFASDSWHRNTCPQCRRDATSSSAGDGPRPSTPVERYHPAQCPYIRALLLDLAEHLSRDPELLAEWHRRAIERYKV
jgi:hypothetical protein